MALAPLAAFLRRHRRIGLDTSVFIYQLEANPVYVSATDTILEWLDSPGHSAVTSTITMTELLVKPYRDAGLLRAEEFYATLATLPGLEWIAATLAIADSAARIRARDRLRTADALQAATAIHTGATGFVTNDSVFSRVAGFETFLLDHAVRS